MHWNSYIRAPRRGWRHWALRRGLAGRGGAEAGRCAALRGLICIGLMASPDPGLKAWSGRDALPSGHHSDGPYTESPISPQEL